MVKKIFFILIFITHLTTICEPRFSFPKEYAQEDITNNTYNIKQEMVQLNKEAFIAISLGENCFPALHLREHGLRVRSFPFDWNITPFESLYAIIENDFDGLMELHNLGINKKENTMYSTLYECKFNHDFDIAEWAANEQGIIPKTAEVLEKYKKTLAYYHRRILRFYNVFTLEVPIYLFRRAINSTQAIRLYNLLNSKFPNSNFILVCIQDEQYESAVNWKKLPKNIICIKMNKMERYEYGIKSTTWTRLLQNLKLID